MAWQMLVKSENPAHWNNIWWPIRKPKLDLAWPINLLGPKDQGSNLPAQKTISDPDYFSPRVLFKIEQGSLHWKYNLDLHFWVLNS